MEGKITEEFNLWVDEMRPDIMKPLDVSGIEGIRPLGLGMKS